MKELHVIVVRRIETFRLMVETPTTGTGAEQLEAALAEARRIIRSETDMKRVNPGIIGPLPGVEFLGEDYEATRITHTSI